MVLSLTYKLSYSAMISAALSDIVKRGCRVCRRRTQRFVRDSSLYHGRIVPRCARVIRDFERMFQQDYSITAQRGRCGIGNLGYT